MFTQRINTTQLRLCQQEAYTAIINHYQQVNYEKNTLIQLPTGAGKSALIAITPFGLAKNKVLVLTPNLKIAEQIEEDLDHITNSASNIYRRLDLLSEDVIANLELYVLKLDDAASHNDIQEHHILIANYHQLQDIKKWFKDDKDSVDLIIIDEAHHQQANTYQEIIKFFDKAKVIGMTATPFRSDGKKLDGEIIYKCSFHRAIEEKIIRNIKVINISTAQVELSFTDQDSKVYTIEQMLQLKEDAWFNQGIAFSQDCCDSIAHRAKQKLEELRYCFPKTSHQIIAVAISKRHARENVKPAFVKLGLKVGMVSSDATDKPHNDKVFRELKQGKIDVIINIGMIGEGFDHTPLGVAAIFRPYKSLSPYIQFVGRVIRKNEDTEHCYIVSHVGLNQIRRFQEFKLFDYDDQKFLEELFASNEDDEATFVVKSPGDEIKPNQKDLLQPSVREIGDQIIDFEANFVSTKDPIESIANQIGSLSEEDKKRLFEKCGVSLDTQVSSKKRVRRVRPIDQKIASRNLLNEREKSIAVDIIKQLELKLYGRDFNPRYQNLVWIKKEISKRVNKVLGIDSKKRKEITNAEYEAMDTNKVLEEIKKDCLAYFAAKVLQSTAD
jgi:superfamily II DNA or RNA helicase